MQTKQPSQIQRDNTRTARRLRRVATALATPDRRSENVRIHAVIVAELELGTRAARRRFSTPASGTTGHQPVGPVTIKLELPRDCYAGFPPERGVGHWLATAQPLSLVERADQFRPTCDRVLQSPSPVRGEPDFFCLENSAMESGLTLDAATALLDRFKAAADECKNPEIRAELEWRIGELTTALADYEGKITLAAVSAWGHA
jgi:hypothetical protein